MAPLRFGLQALTCAEGTAKAVAKFMVENDGGVGGNLKTAVTIKTVVSGAPLHDVYNHNCCHPHCMAYVNSLAVHQTSKKSKRQDSHLVVSCCK